MCVCATNKTTYFYIGLDDDDELLLDDEFCDTDFLQIRGIMRITVSWVGLTRLDQ